MPWLSTVALLVAAESSQEVRLEVVAGCRPQGLEIEAETQWLGEARALTLRDDGSVAGDRAGDGVYAGVWTGNTVRTLPLRLYVTTDDVARTEVSASAEHVAMGSDRLVWALDCDPVLRARRVALALPGRLVDMAESTGLGATLGWFGLVLTYVAWLVQPRREPPRGAP